MSSIKAKNKDKPGMRVGPRQVIDFMSQGWEKRADFGLRVAI